MSKCYCPVCQKETEYFIEVGKTHYSKDNVSFDYDEKYAVCKVCGEDLFVGSINKENQKAFEDAYKATLNIISKDDIESIISKYRISKRNLSLVLGLGELTITRYLDGYIPIKKNSDLLKEILKSPELYLSYLNNNKSNIKPSVYKKSKNQVDELLNINDNDPYIEDVAEYIIKKNSETTNLVLQKLLYYTEVFYMLFKGKKLFKSACGAWPHGPVYGRIYYEFKDYGNEPIDKDFEESNIDDDLKSLLNEIIDSFGIYSGKVLSYFTHHELPWQEAKNNNSEIIDEKSIKEFAEEIKNKYKIKDYKDISKYSTSMLKDYKDYVNMQS